MDGVRGGFGSQAIGWDWSDDDMLDLDGYEDESHVIAEPDPAAGDEPPPPAIGQDERRMQVRAYNRWADLLDGRAYPDIADLDPLPQCDFNDYSVLLDFSAGIEDPVVVHLGAKLAQECGTGHSDIGQLSDVPAGSLLSRITEHYVQILSRQAPIGFEAEFVNRSGKLIVYRGILLPFSGDDDTIDHIYGVLNWKELAETPESAALTDALAGAAARPGDAVVRQKDGLPAPLSRRLRALTPHDMDTLPEDGPEFTLLMARRLSSGNVMLLGEVPLDPELIARAIDRFDGR